MPSFSLKPYLKAVTAFVSTAAAGVLAALLLGSEGGSTITVSEIVAIVATTIVATTAVYAVPNKPAETPQA